MWWNSLIISKTKKTSTYSSSSAVGRWDHRNLWNSLCMCFVSAYTAWLVLLHSGTIETTHINLFNVSSLVITDAESQTPTWITAASNFVCVRAQQCCTVPLMDPGLTVHSLLCLCSPWHTFGKHDTRSWNQKFDITSDRSYPASSTSTAEESCTEISN